MAKWSASRLRRRDPQTIHDDRFKTGRISAVLLLPLQKETAAANMILPFLLRRSCAAYPDFTMLNRRLADLYGAYLYADVRKKSARRRR